MGFLTRPHFFSRKLEISHFSHDLEFWIFDGDMKTWNLKNARMALPRVKDAPKADTRVGSRRRHTVVTELKSAYLYRRAYSETQLLDLVGDFEEGHSYHFLTGGDVDTLSFLKVVLRQQDLDYLLLSTWSMSAEDVLQLDEWMKAGKIRRMDAFVGDGFTGTFRVEWEMLQDLYARHQCGRLVVARIHSKIFAGHGKRFPFVMEGSADICTNMRTENTCITIDKGLLGFVKEFFDGINSIT